MLHIKAPLAYVRSLERQADTSESLRNCADRGRSRSGIVERSRWNGDALYKWRIREDVQLVISKRDEIVGDAESATNRGLAITPRIPSEANPRLKRGVIVPGNLVAKLRILPSDDDAVEWIPFSGVSA